MYDTSRKELTCTNAAEEHERKALGDIYPYKTCAPRGGRNTVTFPKITRFNTYLLRHCGANIVAEINEMLYDGQLAAVCGVDGFYCRQLTHNQCRIDPRMVFWRVNKYEFIADLTIHLKAHVYEDEIDEERIFELYVSLDFSICDEISYELSGVSLQRPDRYQIKLDDYLIPILNIAEVNEAAEALWFAHLPEALHDRRLLDPFKLATKMGLNVAYHRLYKNHKTRSVLYWFDSEIQVTPESGNDETPFEHVEIPASTIVINENAVQQERARLNVDHECFHDEYHWLFFQLQEMHNNDLRSIKKTRKHKNQGQEPKNPLTILEWEAKQGARALMMPGAYFDP